jgi:hypothetical protein
MSQTARGNLPKPEVQIALDPTPQPRLQAIGGGQDVRWNNSLVFGLAYALPRIHGSDCAAVANAAIAGLTNIKPSDPVEGMIAGQMIAAHEAALNIYAWAWNPALRVAKGPGSRASPLQCPIELSRTVNLLARLARRAV